MAAKTKEKSKFEGKKAPAFKLPNQLGEQVSLGDFAGEYLLIYFYPKDMTPGCTVEAQEFKKNMSKLEKLGVYVLGVSCDSVERHQKFIEKEKLNFSLLSDEKQAMVEKYGVWVEKNMYGKKYMGIQRDSFLIGPDQKVLKHYVKVKPAEHAKQVIEDVKALS